MPTSSECVIEIYLYISHPHEQQNIVAVNLEVELKKDSTRKFINFCIYLLSLLLLFFFLSLPLSLSLPLYTFPSLSTDPVDSSKDVPYIVAAV